MNRRVTLSMIGAAALAASVVATAVPGASASTPSAANTARVCAAPAAGDAACLALAVATADGSILSSSSPLDTAFTPDDIQAAYNLKGLKSGGRTVAIVDAYGYSSLESDLKTYRSHYGLPACTTANGCLKIMDQRGGSHLPADDPNWDLEQALDVDAVSAACPDCKIIMVQADTSNLKNLGAAVNTAAKQKGVVAISNSYIGHDRPQVSAYDHPGIAVTAGTGDNGWLGGQYPADDSHVVAVSGTSVHRSPIDGRGFTETAWSGTGSGCAKKNPAPAWQKDAKTTCKTRAVGDVSAAADPNFGGLSIVFHGSFGQVGGTSEATPIIAAVYALSGHTEGYPAKIAYEHPGELNDITSGSNGSCGAPLCTARKGWDGVTGVGTPNGVKGF